MALLTQFQEFDPVSGYVPAHPFFYLPDIANRARSILTGRTAEQIDSAAKRVNSAIDGYFSDLKFQAVNELTVKFQNNPDAYQEFFELDSGTPANGRWHYKNEMDDELGIPTVQNSSEVDALRTIIEDRDSCMFLPIGAPLPDREHWPEGRTHELFAALALKLITDCIRWMGDGRNALNLSIAGACALQAMDAVCFAEHVREVEWLEQFHKKQLHDASSDQDARHINLAEKVRSNLIAERNAHEQAKRTARSERMNAARHQGTKAAKELVCKDWEENFRDFLSAEKAGNHYAAWLEKKLIGYKLKGREMFYQPRAVTNWIREHAKEKGIKFR